MADTYQWIALPRGVDAASGNLQMSVLVSPTLGDNLLDISTHRFFKDWPSIAKGLKFDVWVNGHIYRAGVATRQDLPDSAVWQMLFGLSPAKPPVRVPPGFYIDYPVREVRRDVLKRHAFAAMNQMGIPRSSTDIPEPVAFRLARTAKPTKFQESVQKRDELRKSYRPGTPEGRVLDSLIARFTATDGSDLTPEAWTIIADDLNHRFHSGFQLDAVRLGVSNSLISAYKFHRFHQMQPNSGPRQGGCPPSENQTYDFHQRITLLLGYPYLLRLSGLVLELEFGAITDFGTSPGKQPFSGTVGVRVNTGYAATDTALNASAGGAARAQDPPSLPTYYEIFEHAPGAGKPSRTFFLAGDPAGKIVRGIVDLRQGKLPTHTEYFLETLDTDGAGRKSLSRDANTDDGTKPQPSLRTAGIMLARSDRAEKTAAKLTATPPPKILAASDVMRAMRLDVLTDRDADGRWRSLHERRVAYHFFSRPALDLLGVYRPQDRRGCSSLAEGMVTFTATKATQNSDAGSRDPASEEKKTHETLSRWDNWGLSTDLPIETMENQDQSCDSPPDPRSSLLAAPFPMCEVTTPVKERLAALRVGGTYKGRARFVDLAGNGLGPDDWPDDDGSPYWIGDPDTQSFQPLTYRRWEPVGAPQVLLESQLNLSERPGDSLETIVLRADAATPTVERYVAPPRINRWMAEILGCFDKDTIPGTGAFDNIELEDDGSFPAITPEGHPEASSASSTEQVQPQSDPILRYRYHATDDHAPYYPDPYAPECTVRLMSQGQNPMELGRVVASFYPFHRTWPGAMPFRIVLDELPADSTVSATISYDEAHFRDSSNGRLVMETVTIKVRPGETVQLFLQSNFGTEGGDLRLSRMALWNHLSTSASRSAWEVPERVTRVQQGDLEGLAPTRVLKLVHAVKAPLDLTVTAACNIQRTLADVGADVTLPVRFDVPSADPRFGITASWVDIDDTQGAKPTTVTSSGTIQDFVTASFAPNNATSTQSLSVRIQTATDLMVANQTTATFGEGISVGSSAAGQPGPISVIDPRTATAQLSISPDASAGARTVTITVARDTGAAQYTLPAFTVVSGECRPVYEGSAIGFYHQLGSSRFRRITYTVISHSKYRDLYPKGSSATGKEFRRSVDYKEVCALNTDRPPSPSILYSVPSFGWQRERSHQGCISRRRGGCVRLYLARPWFASGEGELLGVTFIPQIDAEFSDDQIGLTSVWASNPIWRSEPLLDPVGRLHFQGASIFGEDLSLGENPKVKVSVAGYAPSFDEERRLWFCDVKLDPGAAYFPYVRMAVARFQPNSLPGAELSRVVLAPFAQLAPHREVEVKYTENDQKLIATVRGVSYLRNYDFQGPSRVIAGVEERCADIAGNLGWMPTTGKEIELPLQSMMGVASVWRSEIDLPGSRKHQHYRLVFREEETLPVDDLSSPDAWKTKPSAKSARTIFADAVEV